MDLDTTTGGGADDVLFGDGSASTVPPSLLTSAPVIDLAMHPLLPLFAAGLVTGEVEVHEYRTTETRRRPITQQYFKGETLQETNPYNLRMHPKGSVSAMEFTEDGNYLVTASSDRTISVLDCVAEQIAIHIDDGTTKRKITTLTGNRKTSSKSAPLAKVSKKNKNPHKFGISALNVCDVNLLATGDDDGLIAIWDMRQRTPAFCYHEHGDYVSQMIYFSDIQELVSSSGDTCLGVFDLRGGKIRDYSEKRKDELSCFAFVNNTGNNTSTFIPSIVCGTPNGGLPVWKFGSWRRPYDILERHPAECESIISFNNPDSTFNHNIILTGACDGLVRVIQMYPVRRNLCQLSARDFTYSHNNSIGGKSSGGHANTAVRRQRGNEGITRMRLSHDSAILAVCGTDNIIDFVDVRFLSNERELDTLRSQAEKGHLTVLREMEKEREKEEEMEATETSTDDDDDNNDCGRPVKTTKKTKRRREDEEDGDNFDDDVDSDEEEEGEEPKTERQKRRERVAAAKWLKAEKRKKVNFSFEKRRRRVHGFFGDLNS
ncbi:WD domain containing protein [Trypanosoma rangeli]|uniref:WD domain containing protein n=1 Tax=Trypanosoma rangeli TaxID=5698 RepID=A0A422P5D7_TRYRA|nr:WD domain containing protein [Trypanosoma rangeli]RNF12895.1 WD domain containing protein [Trypanosoma rangeli]|eukprot:RNF12895.1 WD domain containing protein [Trypanosoma rangeli]